MWGEAMPKLFWTRPVVYKLHQYGVTLSLAFKGQLKKQIVMIIDFGSYLTEDQRKGRKRKEVAEKLGF
jgi:hypothetical protein